jgi:ABC-2 type transport system permease protein
MSVVNSCFTGLAIGASFSRDQGILKRVRGTPLPAGAYLAARVVVTTLVALLMVAIVVVFGAVLYSVDPPTKTLPAFIVALMLGAACCSALALAVTAIIANADAAPAVVNAIVLPLLFISDVFIPQEQAPEWVTAVANIFPIRHLSVALQTAFNPFEQGWGFEPVALAMMALWTAIGGVLAWRFFSWEPRR